MTTSALFLTSIAKYKPMGCDPLSLSHSLFSSSPGLFLREGEKKTIKWTLNAKAKHKALQNTERKQKQPLHPLRPALCVPLNDWDRDGGPVREVFFVAWSG